MSGENGDSTMETGNMSSTMFAAPVYLCYDSVSSSMNSECSANKKGEKKQLETANLVHISSGKRPSLTPNVIPLPIPSRQLYEDHNPFWFNGSQWQLKGRC